MCHPLRWFLAVAILGLAPLIQAFSAVHSPMSLSLDRCARCRPMLEVVGSVTPEGMLAAVTTDGCSEDPRPSGTPWIQARCKRSIRTFDKVTLALRDRTRHTRFADMIPGVLGGPESSFCLSLPSRCAFFCRFLL